MSIFRYVLVDVFTDTPLTGNQLAVFTDAREIPDHMLQPIAREMNLSETVFCYPSGWSNPARRQQPQGGTAQQGALDQENDVETVFVLPSDDGHARIRIFTPGTELPFAGHPTLGSAFVLGQPLQLTEIRLETGAGVIPVRLEREGARVSFGWMSQPIPQWRPYEGEAAVLEALGVPGSQLPVELYDVGVRHVFVTFAGEDEVARLSPDHAALKQADAGVNCVAGSGTSWKSRMFGAAFGIVEDPASGSAAGPLAVHLIRHGRLGFGEVLEIRQGVEIGRPSKLYARIEGDGERIDTVEVGGSAVIVARGEFRLP